MKKEKLEIPKQKLELMYLNKKMSTSKIASVYNCNPETIRRRLIEFGISRRYRETKVTLPINRIKKLYTEEKISTLELAKKYGCSQWTVRSNLMKGGVKLRKSFEFLRWKNPGNQIRPNLNTSPEISYILGVLLGDAWVYNYGSSYTIGLDVKDQVFCKSFFNALKLIDLNPNIFKKGMYWRTTAQSKTFFAWYKGLSMKEIKKIVSKYPSDFLRGIYESEGCLTANFNKTTNKYYPEIMIVNTDKEIMDLTKRAFDLLGFETRKMYLAKPPHPRKPIWKLGLGKQKQILRFLNTVKPVIKNKHKHLKT